ncbi:hypothetical protein I4U23_028045 [Adineta vaga]|nr:hypothetical protein I4U23_028045 [Adineta vaga]
MSSIVNYLLFVLVLLCTSGFLQEVVGQWGWRGSRREVRHEFREHRWRENRWSRGPRWCSLTLMRMFHAELEVTKDIFHIHPSAYHPR